MTSTAALALHYGLRLDASPEFIQGYADEMTRLDEERRGKACGRSWISKGKKCSDESTTSNKSYAAAKQHYASIGKTSRSDIDLYSDPATARKVSSRRKGSAVVLGEDHAIVTSLRAAENLAKAGYQYA